MDRQTRTDDRTISERVVQAVAEATGRDPLDLRPLYDVIDPDCLNALFPDSGPRDGAPAGRVVFTFDGCRVVVDGEGGLSVSRAVESTPSVAAATTAAGTRGTGR